MVWCLGLATVLLAPGISETAVARSDVAAEYEFTLRQLNKAKARVAELEHRLQELEEERGRLNPPKEETRPQDPQNCEQPFAFDSTGIKRWLDECPYGEQASQPAAAPSCDAPFRVDRDGIKRVRAECVTLLPTDRY